MQVTSCHGRFVVMEESALSVSDHVEVDDWPSHMVFAHLHWFTSVHSQCTSWQGSCSGTHLAEQLPYADLIRKLTI